MNNLDSIWKKFVYLVNEPSWTVILNLTIKQITPKYNNVFLNKIISMKFNLII